MIRIVQRFAVAVACLVTGCAAAAKQASTPPTRTTLLVCGVFGDGPWYDGLRDALASSGSAVETVRWGLPKALFVGNFSGRAVHEKAEAELAKRIDATAGPVDLVGHSAGCGAILGALAKCHRDVGRVVLIAPSVSPGYDVRPALARSAAVDVFYSERDTFFLKWRCATFGTYDAIKTPAAGFAGFSTVDPKLIQHRYDPAWKSLGNEGGHGGGTAADFVRTIVVPILVPSPGTPGEG